MDTNKKGREPIYENSFKVALAREYLTSNLGYGAIAVKYKLPGPDTVRYFVNWYKKYYPVSTLKGNAPLPLKEGIVKADDGHLEKELKEANLKIAALEMLIETAQKELGIDIVKKSGTKQSIK